MKMAFESSVTLPHAALLGLTLFSRFLATPWALGETTLATPWCPAWPTVAPAWTRLSLWDSSLSQRDPPARAMCSRRCTVATLTPEGRASLQGKCRGPATSTEMECHAFDLGWGHCSVTCRQILSLQCGHDHTSGLPCRVVGRIATRERAHSR